MSGYETLVLIGRRTDGRMKWDQYNASFEYTTGEIRNKRFNVPLQEPWDEVIEVRVLRRARIGARIVVDTDEPPKTEAKS